MFPAGKKCPHFVSHTTKHRFVLCHQRSQLWGDLFLGWTNCHGVSTVQGRVVFKVPTSIDVSYKMQLLSSGIADPAHGRSSATVDGVNTDCLMERQDV
jgi:hypothetical protein